MTDWKNQLYFGDNLPILRERVPDESVDPWSTSTRPSTPTPPTTCCSARRAARGRRRRYSAFDDTWHWSLESEAAYEDVVIGGPRKLADLLQAMRGFLGRNDMMAYLTMMAQRMAELRRVLKPTGSIYLHCDPTAGHYLKLLMDAVFGADKFCHDIEVWVLGGQGRTTRRRSVSPGADVQTLEHGAHLVGFAGWATSNRVGPQGNGCNV